MPEENASVFQNSRIGIQSLIGTGVVATFLAQTFGFLPKPVQPTETLAARGNKVGTFTRRQKGANTMAALTGYQCYNELILHYYTLLGIPTVTGGGTASTEYYDYVWLMEASTPDDIRYATVENGNDSTGSSRFADGNLMDMTQTFTATAMDLSGTMIGRRLAEEGVVSNPTPTRLPVIPISADEDSHYVSDTLAGIADGLLGRYFSGNFAITGRRKAIYPKRSDQASWAATVETKNTCKVHIEVEQDSDSNAMMRRLRAAAKAYYQMLAVGPLIPGASLTNYQHEVTMPFTISNPDRGDTDDVYGGMYDLDAVDDATLGGFLRVRIRTTLPASTFAPAAALAAGQQPEALIAAT